MIEQRPQRLAVLADRRNIQQDKASNKVLMTKLDAKKLDQIKETKRADLKFKSKDRELRPSASSYSSSRFEYTVIQCGEYVDDITDYIFHLEKQFAVDEGFLEGKTVTPKMRSLLVDWLVQVQSRYKLLPETLHCTFNLLDRFLSCGEVNKDNLQLVGITCMAIAAKYEEMLPPEVQDYVYITDNAITKRDILQMEVKVLNTLKVDLGRPNVIQFVRRLSEHFDFTVHAMAKYISENAVCDYASCHLYPSVIAAISVWIAARLEDRPFPNNLYRFARVQKEVIHEWAPKFAQNLTKMQTSTKYVALRKKYDSVKNARVSAFTPSQMEILETLSKADADYMAGLP